MRHFVSRAALALVIGLLLNSTAWFTEPANAEGRQFGTIIIGTDPIIYDEVVEGAAAWTATGGVTFIVEPTGCGTGDLTVCVEPWDGPLGWIAWYTVYSNGVASNIISVDSADTGYFSAATACHEIGHYLGITYHRQDYLSCMSDPDPIVAAPDQYDLGWLGISE